MQPDELEGWYFRKEKTQWQSHQKVDARRAQKLPN
jgi:hypothetical protein